MDGITKELEDELREKIGELRYGAAKDRENDVSTNQRQRRIDTFMIEWSGRLTAQREDFIRESRDRIDKALPEVGPGRGVAAEGDRALIVHVEGDKAEAAVKERIAEIRDGMIKAVQHIEKGREPDLAFLAEPQKDRDKPQPELTPERIAEIKAEIARTREAHKSKSKDPEPEL